MIKIINNSPYLQDSRTFPTDDANLKTILEKAYTDTADALNERTIGLFPSSAAAITGEGWYIQSNKKQQSLRRAYRVSSTSSIAHGLDLNEISAFCRFFGTFTDDTNWYGLIPGSSTAIAGQTAFYIDNDNIIFVVGAGSPSLTKGIVVLEWLTFA